MCDVCVVLTYNNTSWKLPVCCLHSVHMKLNCKQLSGSSWFLEMLCLASWQGIHHVRRWLEAPKSTSLTLSEFRNWLFCGDLCHITHVVNSVDVTVVDTEYPVCLLYTTLTYYCRVNVPSLCLFCQLILTSCW